MRDQAVLAERPVYGRLGDRELEDMILLIDDDLRETAQSIDEIERYLIRALKIVDGSQLTRDSVTALADDGRITAAVDRMTDMLSGLRRRLGDLAERLP